MSKKVNMIWKNDVGWTWEADHYEGNGIFFGKVSTPYVPEGEYGSFYLWEIEKDGRAKLVMGDQKFIDEVKRKSKKAMDFQRMMMDSSRKKMKEVV